MNAQSPIRLPRIGIRSIGKSFAWAVMAGCLLLPAASSAQHAARPAPVPHPAPSAPMRANPGPRSFAPSYRMPQQNGTAYRPAQPSEGREGVRPQVQGDRVGAGERGFYGQNQQGGVPQRQGEPNPQSNRSSGQPGGLINPNRPGQTHQHLGPWMQAHGNMSLEQQQRALDQEPGFHQLPPEQQQRMHNRLTQLNNMNPQQRQSMIDRTEAMERLSPQQRQQVRSAAGELGNLPPDRRRAVAQAFRGLQSMPPDQRQTYMNSPQFRGQFNDQERGTLNNLMQVSPYLPMRRAAPPQ